MKLTNLFPFLLLNHPLAIAHPTGPGLETDALVAQGLANLHAWVDKHGYPSPETCTFETASVRREWSQLSRPEKQAYISAVQCLGTLPALTPASVAPGARSRYDDFVVTHILQTQYTHGNGNFLSWHRLYMQGFETALRNECNYSGSLPYYNWPQWADDPASSPLLDGSDTSLSGDGEYVPGRNATCVPTKERCFVSVEPGRGGGCVRSGPFVKSLDTTVPPNPSPDGLGYNPRCLKRDISRQSSLDTSDSLVAALIKNSATIATFQDTLQNPSPGTLHIHLGGHNTISGDAGSDFYNSPSDPYFWLHHAMVDRVWWTWQNMDLEQRRETIAGTLTFQNIPPTRNATLDDMMGLGEWVDGGREIRVRDAGSSLAGRFCYVYT